VGCPESEENLYGYHYFAYSWAMTLGDFGTLNAYCLSTVPNIWCERVIEN